MLIPYWERSTKLLSPHLEPAVQRRDACVGYRVCARALLHRVHVPPHSSKFRNLEKQLGKGEPLWPSVEITQEEVDEIGKELRRLVPSLRSESFLPDVEYSVEYNVPILPGPLSFVRLSRNENRADPVIMMGYSVITLVVVMLLLVLFIILPPWVPSK